MKADGFLNVRQAAAYVGYEPAPERAADGTKNTAREDPAIKAFYAWANSHHVKKFRRGSRLLFRRADLDVAIGNTTEEYDASRMDALGRMADLARRHARGETVQ